MLNNLNERLGGLWLGGFDFSFSFSFFVLGEETSRSVVKVSLGSGESGLKTSLVEGLDKVGNHFYRNIYYIITISSVFG